MCARTSRSSRDQEVADHAHWHAGAFRGYGPCPCIDDGFNFDTKFIDAAFEGWCACWSHPGSLLTLCEVFAAALQVAAALTPLRADSDEVARVYRYEVARGFRDDVAHLSDLISPGGEAF